MVEAADVPQSEAVGHGHGRVVSAEVEVRYREVGVEEGGDESAGQHPVAEGEGGLRTHDVGQRHQGGEVVAGPAAGQGQASVD